MAFECPNCGATSGLKGKRDGDVTELRCTKGCGHEWTHDAWRCSTCGDELAAVRKPLLQKARGTQQSIIGYRTEKHCVQCDGPAETDMNAAH